MSVSTVLEVSSGISRLREQIASMPQAIGYEAAQGGVSRQHFLDYVATSVHPEASILVYLVDPEQNLLTLAYSSRLSHVQLEDFPRFIPLRQKRKRDREFFSFEWNRAICTHFSRQPGRAARVCSIRSQSRTT